MMKKYIFLFFLVVSINGYSQNAKDFLKLVNDIIWIEGSVNNSTFYKPHSFSINFKNDTIIYVEKDEKGFINSWYEFKTQDIEQIKLADEYYYNAIEIQCSKISYCFKTNKKFKSYNKTNVIIKYDKNISTDEFIQSFNSIINYYKPANERKVKNVNLTENNEIYLPPILSISDISLSKNLLNAEESARLSITLNNVGPGDANNVYVSFSGNLEELIFPSKTYFPTIKANGGKETVDIEITTDIDLPTSEAIIRIEVFEPNFKVKIKGKQLKFPTQAFHKPELILAKYSLIEKTSSDPNNQVNLNEIIDLKFAVQNIGEGMAENVNIDVKNNQEGVMFLGVASEDNQLKRQHPNYREIKSGKYETITYRYFINSEFKDEQLTFDIKSIERRGKYGFDQIKSFPINKDIREQGSIRTIAQNSNNDNTKREVIIEDIPDFVVDVDVNIPKTTLLKNNTYALIIGNEDYSSKQKGLSWINNLAKIENGNAELIFYYSGHGLPNELTKESYIIPVDVAGQDLNLAVNLNEVYSKLIEHPSKQVTVFLDACFSGGARSESLLASKAVRIKPKENEISSNMIVFTSSSGIESSSVYEEKNHGYFTYFLLKKLQETKGNVTLGELGEFINKGVSKETSLINKPQTPKVIVSPKIQNNWESFKLL